MAQAWSRAVVLAVAPLKVTRPYLGTRSTQAPLSATPTVGHRRATFLILSLHLPPTLRWASWPACTKVASRLFFSPAAAQNLSYRLLDLLPRANTERAPAEQLKQAVDRDYSLSFGQPDKGDTGTGDRRWINTATKSSAAALWCRKGQTTTTATATRATKQSRLNQASLSVAIVLLGKVLEHLTQIYLFSGFNWFNAILLFLFRASS